MTCGQLTSMIAALVLNAGHPSDLLVRLTAPGPDRAYAQPLMDFGRLVGHWRMRIETFDERGSIHQKITGVWDFGWILRGRAIQDVFVT